MRVCVVICGRIAPELADVMPAYPDSFRALLETRLPEARFDSVSAIDGEFPASVDDHDVYIFTGSPHGVYEEHDWIRTAEALVREAVAAGKVIVGGCFGHQLVAQALGGRVVKSDKGWGLGVNRHEIVRREPWMAGGLEGLNVLVSHQDQVVELPPGGTVLAGSDFCPYAMLRIGERVVTMQGHPEMNLATVDRLLEIRREKVGETVFEAGKQSLGTPLDHAVMAEWLAAFIRSAAGGGAARPPAETAVAE